MDTTKVRQYVVSDEFGDPLRTFLSKQEAEQFIKNREGFTYKKLAVPKVDLYELLGECLL